MPSSITFTHPALKAPEPLISKSYNILLTDSAPDERQPIISAPHPQFTQPRLNVCRESNIDSIDNNIASIDPVYPRSSSPTTVTEDIFYDSIIPISPKTVHGNNLLHTYKPITDDPPPHPPPNPAHFSNHCRSASISLSLPKQAARRQVPSSPKRQTSFLGTVLVLCCAVTFASNAFLVRVAEAHYGISTMAVSFTIFSVSSMIACGYVALFVPRAVLYKSLFARPAHARLLVVRGICGALASACCYCSFERLPVGDAVAIYNVCPGLTTLTALVFLHEGAGGLEIVSLLLGLCGAYLVANPSNGTMSSERLTGAVFALGDAAFSALAYTTVRFLSGSVHFSLSVGIVGLLGSIITAALGGASELLEYVSEHPETAVSASAAAVAAAVLLFVAQSLLDKGLQYCPAGRAMLLRTLEVPFAYALGMAFLGETPSTTGVIGSGLVVTAACVIAVVSKR